MPTFCLYLILGSKYKLHSVKAKEKWHHLHLDWSPCKLHLTMLLMLPLGWILGTNLINWLIDVIYVCLPASLNCVFHKKCMDKSFSFRKKLLLMCLKLLYIYNIERWEIGRLSSVAVNLEPHLSSTVAGRGILNSPFLLKLSLQCSAKIHIGCMNLQRAIERED